MANSDPDRVLCGYITGAAWRLARSGIETPEQHTAAVVELREVAGGRADLLAEVTGIAIGSGESKLDREWYQQVASLCRAAGADEGQIPAWVQVGRSRAEYAKIPPSAGVLRRW
jgi:hypothetical protein